LSELAILAEQYLDAHANSKNEWPKKPMYRGQETGDKKLGRVKWVTGMQNQKQKETALIVAILVILLEENVSTLEKVGILLETVFSPRR